MSHPNHDIFESRKQFQLERMILFSDAVFAIAITLLIIEIKIPELINNDSLWPALLERWHEFFGLALSFAVIGQFWTNHHRLFGYVTNYDGSLLWLNLHLLFWIILMPFSSALNSRYGNHNSVWMFYCFNMFMIGLAIYFIWRYILSPRRDFSTLTHDPQVRKMALARSFVIALIFLSGALFCLLPGKLFSIIARMVFFLIFPAIVIIKKMYGGKPLKNNPAL